MKWDNFLFFLEKDTKLTTSISLATMAYFLKHNTIWVTVLSWIKHESTNVLTETEKSNVKKEWNNWIPETRRLWKGSGGKTRRKSSRRSNPDLAISIGLLLSRLIPNQQFSSFQNFLYFILITAFCRFVFFPVIILLATVGAHGSIQKGERKEKKKIEHQ